MQPAETPCSDHLPQLGRLLVLEGMPGAGKTTAVTRLGAEGWQVIGEYTTASGATIPVSRVHGERPNAPRNLCPSPHSTFAGRAGARAPCTPSPPAPRRGPGLVLADLFERLATGQVLRPLFYRQAPA
jgi:hypothetical protein